MERPERTRVWIATLAAGGLAAVTSFNVTYAQVAEDPVEPARAAIRVKNFRQAVDILGPLADRGDAQAQYLLGSLYRVGLGAPVDESKARALLLAAAQRNHAASAYSLAMLLAHSEPPKPEEASAWLQRAAKAGHSLAVAAVKRGALPLEFLPERDLMEADARRAAVWIAVQQNDAQLVTALAGADGINLSDDFGRGALAVAAQSGARDVVSLLLQRGARPDQADSFAVTPLMLAARNGNASIVEALLRARAPLDAVDRVGNSALMYAAAAAHEKIVAQLLDAGAPFATLNAQGWSALDWALQADAAATAQLLKARGLSTRRSVDKIAGTPAIPLRRAGPGAKDLYLGLPDVQVAASRSSPKLLQAVLQQERDLGRTAPPPDGAVFFAAVTGSSATLEALLAAGANVRSAGRADPLPWVVIRGNEAVLPILLARRTGATDKGEPALITAVRAHRAASVKALLDANADPEVTDETGRTPLMLAAASAQKQTANELLHHLARIERTDNSKRTALWYAAAAGDVEIVATLLAAKATVDAGDSVGFTPLAIAAAKKHEAVVQALLKAGARASATTRNGSTALMLAAQGGNTGIMRQLLAAKVGVDAQNRFGDTALIVATRAGHVAAVRELLAAGASDRLRNADRATALDVASALERKEIEALLRRG